ncbi:MAG: FkbM family methyltransferase [Cyanobium sp.]
MFNKIRQKFHPLFHLRKNGIYRQIQRVIDPDISIKIHGFQVYLKLLRDLSVILSQQEQEKEVVDLASSLMSSAQFDVFIDVGANIGLYSWLAKKHNVSDIFMFEPDRTNCRLLMRTLKANHLEHVFLVPFAASAVAGVEQFYPDSASGATGSLSLNPHSLHSAYGIATSVALPTLPLNTFADFCCNKKVLLKIDVEGAEASMFAGAMRFLEQAMPTMIVECFDASRLDVLRPLGYSRHSIDDKGNYLLTPPGFAMPK